MSEAKIRINGILLSEGASMTIRVAIESFCSYLANEGLGDDQQGKQLVSAYQAQLVSIRHALYTTESKGGSE